VNDAPKILSFSPLNGTKYKEGSTISFSVDIWDEDDEDLLVVWQDGKWPIEMVTSFNYSKLKPGERTITVTVLDGEESVSEEFTLIIEKKEFEPGFIIAIIITVIWLSAVGLILLYYLKRGRR
ncbi:MAG: hypothetical protein KAS77_01355, partial [Thermoplasmata archaeon]|nr:hypothetical protein [Thermoplasmata archaeon]